MDKIALKNRLMSLEAAELAAARAAYADYAASARVDASDTIREQDTSEAVQSRELADAFEVPVHDHERAFEALAEVDFGPKDTVEPGAVVELADRVLVVGAPAGVFDFEGVRLVGVSAQAPIYKAIEGLRAGETFEFGGRVHLIKTVL